MDYFVPTQQHWQARSNEMRALAKSVEGRDAQDAMLRMAQHYDRLAADAGERSETARPKAHISQATPSIRTESALWWLNPKASNPPP